MWVKYRWAIYDNVKCSLRIMGGVALRVIYVYREFTADIQEYNFGGIYFVLINAMKFYLRIWPALKKYKFTKSGVKVLRAKITVLKPSFRSNDDHGFGCWVGGRGFKNRK